MHLISVAVWFYEMGDISKQLNKNSNCKYKVTFVFIFLQSILSINKAYMYNMNIYALQNSFVLIFCLPCCP